MQQDASTKTTRARFELLATQEHLFTTSDFGTRPRGFEPLTFGSVDRRSIQLSYGRNGRLSSLAAASGEGGIRTRDGDCLPVLAYCTQRLSPYPSAARNRCKSVTSPAALAGVPADLAPSVASIRASMRA